MSELRVSAWKRYGQDRLYVNRPDGECVAWLDLRTDQVTIRVEAFRDAALAALAPYLAEPPAPARATTAPPPDPVVVRRPPSPVPAEFDLATNRPGDALRVKIAELSPGPYGRLVAWLLRRPTEADRWRAGLAGERIIAGELERLNRHGWRCLHSIPLPRLNADIDHLLIGPGGVFTINTKNFRAKSIWVGDETVKVNHGPARPLVGKSRREAARAARVLSQRCGFPVSVLPILAFVRPAELTVVPTLTDARAIRDRELAALAPLAGVLAPGQVEAVYAAARDRRTWADA